MTGTTNSDSESSSQTSASRRGNRNSYLRNYEPLGNAPCLCGSAKRFKHCCRHRYTSSTGYLQQTSPQLELESVRAEITWYRLCHLAHTARLLESGDEQILELLNIDIEALSEMLETLLHCYVKCQILEKFPTALSFMGHAIADPKWQLKLDYLHCLYLAVYSSDLKSALAIADRYDWQDINDAKFLTLWLDLKSNKLNHIQVVPVAERILSMTESPNWTPTRLPNPIGGCPIKVPVPGNHEPMRRFPKVRDNLPLDCQCAIDIERESRRARPRHAWRDSEDWRFLLFQKTELATIIVLSHSCAYSISASGLGPPPIQLIESTLKLRVRSTNLINDLLVQNFL